MGKIPNATVGDRIYLIRGTSNHKVSKFSDQTRRPSNQWKGSRNHNDQEPGRRESQNNHPSEKQHQNPSGEKQTGKNGYTNGKPNQSRMNKKDLDAIKRVMEQVCKEEEENADLFSVIARLTASEKHAPPAPKTPSSQLNAGVKGKGGFDLTEPEQSGHGSEEPVSSAALVVQLDSNETPTNKGLPSFQGELPLQQF